MSKRSVKTDTDDPNTDLKRAREQQAATQDILESISKNRDDEAPVFDAILENAARLCRAPHAGLLLCDADDRHLILAAMNSEQSGYADYLRANPHSMDDETSLTVEAVRSMEVRQYPDIEALAGDTAVSEQLRNTWKMERMRTLLYVPLIKGDRAIGVIGLYRLHVEEFSDEDIEILKLFAAQAVIAIENVRQFREVQERLERERATSEVLSIISKSRDDETPVFEAILNLAIELCEAELSMLLLVDPEKETLKYICAAGGEVREEPLDLSIPLDDPMGVTTAARTVKVVHQPDLKDDQLYRDGHPTRVALVDVGGILSQLAVPLVQNDRAVGVISLNRREQKAFSPGEIALVETFAAQAVIAIENVRQFREVRTRLERETATKNILGVISQSNDDELPVFDTILSNATRLCNAPMAGLVMVDKDRERYELVASLGANPEFVDAIAKDPPDLDPERFAAARAIVEKRVVHVEDLAAPGLFGAQADHRIKTLQTEGMRTTLFVPLIWDEKSIGAIGLWRREVKPFHAEEIALIETFAVQAVIAIENVRQFREVQTRLEREKASAEILEVISQSRSDAQPVFSAILENAARLCGAPHAMLLLRDEADQYLALAANNAARSTFIDRIRDMPHRLDNHDSYAVQAIHEKRVIHVPDLRVAAEMSDDVPQIKVALDLEGMRTVLQVPLLQSGRAIGVIALYKLEVAPFTEDQIKLVETFAAQAVIAIENTKQLQSLETLNAELGERVDEQVHEIERMGRLKRFLPAAVADTVVSSGSDELLSSHRALLGVLFCDIRGFTAFCETAEPEETIEVLQTYHEEMGKLINCHGAGVDHRMGDGIMVLFNDPLPCDDPAGDAVRLALAMQERMSDLCKSWKRMGYRLGFGVGVSLGYATVGMVGFEGRFDYTASGTAINLASRLCDEAEDGEVLLSPRAAIAVEDVFQVESRGELNLKGLREPLEVFRLAATETT